MKKYPGAYQNGEWRNHKMKANYRIRTIICLSMFLFTTQSFSAQDEFVKITRERYSISYPKSWTVDTSKRMGMDLMLLSLKTDSLDDFFENMNVIVQELPGQNYTLAQIGQESLDQIKTMVTDFELVENKLDSNASQQRYIVKYTGRQGKYSLTQIQHYYLKDEVGYALTFTIKGGKEPEFNEIAERMFNSFKLR